MILWNVSALTIFYCDRGIDICDPQSRRLNRISLYEFECSIFKIIIYDLQQPLQWETRQVYTERSVCSPDMLKFTLYHCCRFAIVTCVILFTLSLMFYGIFNTKFYAVFSIYPMTCIATILVAYHAAVIYVDKKV